MNIHFKFSNLIGSFYTGGDLRFSDDGWRLFSPVGNQVSVYDLKQYKSLTLQIGARKSIERVALAPGNALMLAIDEDGTAYLYSLVAKSVLHRHRFNRHIFDVAFCRNSSGDLLFSLTFDNLIHVYKILSLKPAGGGGSIAENPLVASVQYNPFELMRSYFGPTSETVCLDWSGDGRTFLVGSRDMSVRLFAAEKCPNLAVYVLAHHKDSIIACRFLSDNTLDCFSLSRDGQLCVWQCDTKLDDLFKPADSTTDEKAAAADGGANDVKSADDAAGSTTDADNSAPRRRAVYKGNMITYKRVGRHYYRKNVVTESYVNINAVCYSKSNRILACALSNGILCIHEMPNFVQIQSLNIGESQIITALRFNNTAEWIAMASSQTGQLIVYDWRAQSYVVNQTGHFNQMTCAAYAPDGSSIATGSEDGKIKVWDPSSGFCTVTFAGEHTGAITALQFTQAGRAVLSASRDGTIRAYDLVRYRNFRTFTAPTQQQVQFSCLAVDASGDMVAAASSNGFEAFVWSVKTGRLLEELTGHEAPISGIAFGQAAGRALLLATSSWDKTCKLWDCFTTSKQQSHETLRLDADGLAVAFRADGAQLAVCTLRSTIYLFASPPDPGSEAGTTIDARHDLGKLRRNKDMVSGAHSSQARSFTTLCYTTDGGTCLLVGGQTKYICMYHVAQRQLIKRFSITCNFSLDRMEEFLRRSQMTDFGSRAQMQLTSGSDTTSRITNIDAATGANNADKLRLPGVRGGQSLVTSREHLQPEARCVWLCMSPTGQTFAACTQDGLQIYSLSSSEIDVFNPFDLDITIDPSSIYAVVDAVSVAGDEQPPPDYGRALLMALKLNKPDVTTYVVERIPHDRIPQIVRSVPRYALTRLVEFIANQLDATKHVEFYLIWIKQLVFVHGMYMKQQQQTAGTTTGRRVDGDFRAATNLLIKCLTEKKTQVGKMVDHALYTSRYVIEQSALAETRSKSKKKSSQNQTLEVEQKRTGNSI